MVLKYKNLAPKIIRLRKSLGDKTQQAFGKRFNPPVNRSTIAHWETQRSEPTSKQILEMASFTNERTWWWRVYLADDDASESDHVEYSNTGGNRTQWVTSADHDQWDEFDEASYREQMLEESTNPKDGALFVALQIADPEEQIKALQNLIQKPDSSGLLGRMTELGPDGQKMARQIQVKIESEKDVWDSLTRNFKQAVIHSFITQMPEASPYVDRILKRGSFKKRADFCDDISLVMIQNEQVKFKQQNYLQHIGVLYTLEKLHGTPMQKMLAMCVDMENPKIHYAMLEDIATAKSMGITLTFVTPKDNAELATEIIKFVKENQANKHKLRGGLGSLIAGENGPIRGLLS